MLPKCEHGVRADDGRYNGQWNAPFSRCMCCGVMFPYIDSASYGQDGASGTSWTPKDRCGACGGRYEKWEMKPSMTHSKPDSAMTHVFHRGK